MKRILIIGTSGVGKSTLAQRLANHLQIPFFASDHFYWETGWKIASTEKVRQQVMNVVEKETWILDGNFDDEREWVWKRADCIIWLDYSLPTISVQIILRNLRWVITGQQTWSGNRMTLSRAFSGITHSMKFHPIKRRNYPRWLSELTQTSIHRFCTNSEADAWLQSLKPN